MPFWYADLVVALGSRAVRYDDRLRRTAIGRFLADCRTGCGSHARSDYGTLFATGLVPDGSSCRSAHRPAEHRVAALVKIRTGAEERRQGQS